MATRAFGDLDERELLTLAISFEEEDGRIYGDFVEGLRETFPATAEILERMHREEGEHRRRLIDEFQRRFGDHIPLVRRQDVKGFVERKAWWLARPLALETVRQQAGSMELETRRFTGAFGRSNADGLLALLAGGQPAPSLPPDLSFWRDFARRYLQRLCQVGNEAAAAAPRLPIEPTELTELTLQAPPMRGGAEFQTPQLLETL